LALPEKNKKFIYNDAVFLLTLVITGNAFFNIKSLDNIQNIKILIIFKEIKDLISLLKDGNIFNITSALIRSNLYLSIAKSFNK
jgi:hypothetical protein